MGSSKWGVWDGGEALKEYHRDAGDFRNPLVWAQEEVKNRGKNLWSGR